MVITSACQAEDGSSILPSRSNVNLKKGPSVSLSGLLGPGLLFLVIKNLLIIFVI